MAKVAPMMNGMPRGHGTAAPAPPPPSSDDYCLSFWDDLLDICGCGHEDDCGDDSSRDDLGEHFVLAGPADRGERRQRRQHPRKERPQPTSSSPRSVLSPPADRLGDGGDVGRPPNPGTIILPHLRFRPLPPSVSAASSRSSLKEFFDIFLADAAPQPFRLFHESNGDEDVQVTPWETAAGSDICVAQDCASANIDENTAAAADSTAADGASICNVPLDENGRMERTITFRTKTTPGTSSNPLSQSDTNSNNSTTIPLGVTIVQSLSLHKNKWILRCEFSFDFDSPAKKLGTGLGQYLVGNVVRGSSVSVAVTLTECDEVDGTGPAKRGHGRKGEGASSASLRCIPEGCAPPECRDEGFLSCLSHPLLLPPEGLCSTSGGRVASYRGTIGKDGKLYKAIEPSLSKVSSFEEPAQAIGASLLSAIKAKNAPNDAEFGGPDEPLASEAESLARRPSSNSRFSDASSWIEGSWIGSVTRSEQAKPKREERAPQPDVLSCSSRGSLKLKNIPSFDSSFDLDRAPSTASANMMRRMLLERGSEKGSGVDAPPTAPSANDKDARGEDDPPSVGSPQAQGGLSMRIEMELTSPPPSRGQSNASSLSGARIVASATNLDEKIRRGLKKRVARSWILWAESWCMRLWMEESAERDRRKAAGVAVVSDSMRRRKVNVRPVVRRIGEPRETKKERVLPGDNRATNPWKRLQVDDSGGDSFDRSVWRSSDRKDEGGVEVACAVALSSSSPSKASSAVSPSAQSSSTVKRSTLDLANVKGSPPPASSIADSPPEDPRRKEEAGGKQSMKRRLSMLKRGA